VFLAKLVNLQRRLNTAGGALALAQLSPNTRNIFQVAGLDKYFRFYPTQAEALTALA
jgi:anti-anti-sigma regulatory factor